MKSTHHKDRVHVPDPSSPVLCRLLLLLTLFGLATLMSYARADEAPGAQESLTESLERLHQINRNLQRELGKSRAQMQQLTVERDNAAARLRELELDLAATPDTKLVERISTLEAELAREREMRSSLLAELEQLRSSQSPRINDSSAAILDAVEQWRRDWESGDSEVYLAHYAADFRPGRGEDLDSWRQRRIRTLAAALQVQIELHDVTVKLRRGQEAKVVFLQHYRSASYNDRVEKQLDLVLQGDVWKIHREQVLSIR